jgi:hypothetical protein
LSALKEKVGVTYVPPGPLIGKDIPVFTTLHSNCQNLRLRASVLTPAITGGKEGTNSEFDA